MQDDIPDEYLPLIMHYLSGLENGSVDLSKAHLRKSFNTFYPLVIFVYALLVIFGTLANLAMVYHIVKYGLHKDTTCAFLINIAIVDVIKCVFVLPISLAVLLVQNWIFGRFMCYFLPILQVSRGEMNCRDAG